MIPRILVLAGSVRAASFNRRLAAVMAKELALLGAEVTLVSALDYPLPIYDGDFEAEKGVPEAAEKLARLVRAHDGVFLASPEYNAGVSPLMKNTLDWVSRIGPPYAPRGSVFSRRAFAIGSASPGMAGGQRGLMMLRQVLELGLGAYVISEQVLIQHATKAFDEAGELVDPRHQGLSRQVARCLVEFISGEGLAKRS